MDPRRLVCLAVVAVSALAAPARADTPPTVWDSAKNRSARPDYRLHTETVERIMVERQMPQDGPRGAHLARAIMELEAGNARDSRDVRLRFDLGQAYQRARRHKDAVDVLLPALESAPDHTAAPEAWWSLALAAAYIEDSALEKRAYIAFIERTRDETARHTGRLNLAETEMRLGNLRTAIAGYEDAIGLASQAAWSSDTYALALWGLAVARDRAEDPTGALREATRALAADPQMHRIQRDPNVFFVPAYERLWYVGLGHMAGAAGATRPIEQLAAWESAARTWQLYLRAAAPTERWLPLAKAHLARSERERDLAKKRVAKLPTPPPSDEQPLIF